MTFNWDEIPTETLEMIANDPDEKLGVQARCLVQLARRRKQGRKQAFQRRYAQIESKAARNGID